MTPSVWWPTYKFEEYPGMYDLAWRRVISRYPKAVPAPNTAEAESLRDEVKEELKRCRNTAYDVLANTGFAKQVIGDCKSTDLAAFKRALMAQGLIKAAPQGGGWQWADKEKTFKVIPLPEQSGHEDLLRRYKAELAVAINGAGAKKK